MGERCPSLTAIKPSRGAKVQKNKKITSLLVQPWQKSVIFAHETHSNNKHTHRLKYTIGHVSTVDSSRPRLLYAVRSFSHAVAHSVHLSAVPARQRLFHRCDATRPSAPLDGSLLCGHDAQPPVVSAGGLARL